MSGVDVRHNDLVDRLMLLLARHLAFLASLLSSSGGTWAHCPQETIGRSAAHILSHLPRTEFIHSPAHLPSKPRPVVDCLHESGIDEEDTDKLDTAIPSVLACDGFDRGVLRISLSYPSPDRIHLESSTATAVLRC